MRVFKSVIMRLALARQISCFKELQGLYSAARNPENDKIAGGNSDMMRCVAWRNQGNSFTLPL